jgi:hypothetical protein
MISAGHRFLSIDHLQRYLLHLPTCTQIIAIILIPADTSRPFTCNRGAESSDSLHAKKPMERVLRDLEPSCSFSRGWIDESQPAKLSSTPVIMHKGSERGPSVPSRTTDLETVERFSVPQVLTCFLHGSLSSCNTVIHVPIPEVSSVAD